MILKNGMSLAVELVTPQRARALLSHPSNKNRRLSKDAVNKYTMDMLNDAWETIPHAICIMADGSLGNGQHTLHAVIASGKTLSLLVARNVPESVIAKMDVGKSRSINDIAHFYGDNFGQKKATIAKTCEYGFAATKKGGLKSATGLEGDGLSYDAALRLYESHQEAVDWAFELCGIGSASKSVKGLGAVPAGLLARASYTCDRSRLAEFVTVFRSGVATTDTDSAAIRYRDYVLESDAMSGWSAIADTYGRLTNALRYFVERKPLAKLYMAKTEFFQGRGE